MSNTPKDQPGQPHPINNLRQVERVGGLLVYKDDNGHVLGSFPAPDQAEETAPAAKIAPPTGETQLAAYIPSFEEKTMAAKLDALIATFDRDSTERLRLSMVSAGDPKALSPEGHVRPSYVIETVGLNFLIGLVHTNYLAAARRIVDAPHLSKKDILEVAGDLYHLMHKLVHAIFPVDKFKREFEASKNCHLLIEYGLDAFQLILEKYLKEVQSAHATVSQKNEAHKTTTDLLDERVLDQLERPVSQISEAFPGRSSAAGNILVTLQSYLIPKEFSKHLSDRVRSICTVDAGGLGPLISAYNKIVWVFGELEQSGYSIEGVSLNKQIASVLDRMEEGEIPVTIKNGRAALRSQLIDALDVLESHGDNFANLDALGKELQFRQENIV